MIDVSTMVWVDMARAKPKSQSFTRGGEGEIDGKGIKGKVVGKEESKVG